MTKRRQSDRMKDATVDFVCNRDRYYVLRGAGSLERTPNIHFRTTNHALSQKGLRYTLEHSNAFRTSDDVLASSNVSVRSFSPLSNSDDQISAWRYYVQQDQQQILCCLDQNKKFLDMLKWIQGAWVGGGTYSTHPGKSLPWQPSKHIFVCFQSNCCVDLV